MTTAADLAQIYRVAIQDPRLQEILTAKQAEFRTAAADPTKARGDFTIFNNDNLLNQDYPGFLGGKSGFTSQAGRTYVAGAEQDGRRLIVALLGIGGAQTQTAGQLLDWSFANADRLSPIGQLQRSPGRRHHRRTGGHCGSQRCRGPSYAGAEPGRSRTSRRVGGHRREQGRHGDCGSSHPRVVDTGVAAIMNVSASPPRPSSWLSRLGFGPAQRGLLASLLVGLFKAFMWLLLFLGVAVVLLRIRSGQAHQAAP